MSPRGFTLLELILVIAILGLLAAMAMPMFSGELARRQLIESAEQLRSLMYLTSAEAKQSGRRLELRFVDPAPTVYLDEPAAGATARAVEVRVEQDPLGEPGVFEPFRAGWARWAVAGSGVQVAQVLVGEVVQTADAEGGSGSSGLGGEDDAAGPPSIVFGPDGRSQVGDVTVTLVNEQVKGYLVLLRATTGLATIEPMPDPEAEENVE